ncbi:hypothetical protein AB1Y20_014676 [Prymnesium parvum]|uniref:PH domain-containing protein n=1 Tax=Prymnesium parvum TaxID=97485 RepID=A0AB34IE56_PRYPA
MAPPSFGKELYSGWLLKKSKHGLWQKRYFLLDEHCLTYYSHGIVHTFRLSDWADVEPSPSSAADFTIVFSGTAPEVFPERRLHLRALTGGAPVAREWAAQIAAARRQADLRAAPPAAASPPPPLAPPSLAPPALTPPPLAPPPPPPPPPPPVATAAPSHHRGPSAAAPPPPADGLAAAAGAPPREQAPCPTPPHARQLTQAPPHFPHSPHSAATTSASTTLVHSTHSQHHPFHHRIAFPLPTHSLAAAAAEPAAPSVVSFEEGVRRQLRKKANVVIVERREEVLELIRQVRTRTFASPPSPHVSLSLSPRGAAVSARLSVEPADASAPVVAWFSEVCRQLEALHLPLECEKGETWGARLAIPRKGGGTHFSAEEQAEADAAYARVGVLYEYVSASTQLASKAEQLRRLSEERLALCARSALAVQSHLSSHKRLERFAQVQSQALALASRVAATAAELRPRAAAARLPDSLGASLRLLRRSLAAMWRDVAALAAREYEGWRGEAAAKRRFRTPQCHKLLFEAAALGARQLEASDVKAEWTAEDEAALALLRQREVELAEATVLANASLAEVYDDAV